MTQLCLTEDEVAILSEMVDLALSDLRMEIVDTDRLDFKGRLRGRKVTLDSLAQKLHEAGPEAPVAGGGIGMPAGT